MSFNTPIRFFRDPAADQAALNNQLNITNQLNQLIEETIREQRDLVREINNELKGGINYTKEARKNYNAIESITDKLLDDAEDLIDLTQKQLERDKVRATKALDRLRYVGEELFKNEAQIRAKRKLTNQEEALLAAAKKNFEEEDATLKLINERIEKQKILNKSVGLTGALLKGSAKLMEKIGFSGTIVEDVLKDAKKAVFSTAKELERSGKNMDSLGIKTRLMLTGVKTLGAGLLSSLKDPLVLLTLQIALLKKVFDLYGSANKRIVDQQKQLGISYKESERLRKSAQDYAISQRDSFANEVRILEGRHKLNEALGTSIAFTNKEAITAEKLEHFYGLSAEQNGRLAEFSRQINKTNDDVLNTIIRTTNEQKRQFGGSLSIQKTVQKVSSISGEILTKFKGNVRALTEAVMQADRLGLTLEQVDKVGESLLNFESSIENELKAELLTGRAINVEKARAAALSGDQIKLMNEITSQVGNIHEFEKMNVIQRKAYAEAFGMEVNEMGNMLRKKDLEAKLGTDISKSATEALKLAQQKGITIEDSLRQELEARSLAELQKDIFQKILSIISRITEGPMRTFYGYLEKGLRFIEKIFGYFGKMTGGALGDALGAAILGIPITLLAFRTLMGGAKSLILGPRGSSPANPMFVTMGMGTGGMMGGGVGGNMMTWNQYQKSVAGQGLTPAQRAAGYQQYRAGFGGTATPKGRFAAGSPGAIGAGIGLGIGGMALSGIASGMEEGAGKNTIGVLGQTATYAGMGMMFGPWGAAIGGLVGLGMGLFSLSKENEERRKAETAKKAEDDKNFKNLVESLAVRPLQLNVGNESVAKFSTQQSLTNANPKYS